VNARLVEAHSRSVMTSFSRSSASDEDLFLTTAVTSVDVTDREGRFTVLLPQRARYLFSATAAGYPSAGKTQEVEVEGSREDLVVALTSGVSLAVRVRDASTGELLPGSFVSVTSRGTSTGIGGIGDDATARFESVTTKEPVTVTASKAGYAPSVRKGVELEAGRPATIEMRLSRGGELRVKVPPGAVTRDPDSSWPVGPLHAMDEQGHDYLSRIGAHGSFEGEELAPGEWRFPHLPEGPMTVSLGEGDTARAVEVEIREGVPAVADLR
jgi:hypothetical protein